jgi:hypothetical protein
MAQIITFLIFGGLGLMLLVVGATQLWQQRRNMAHARSVLATIEHSAVVSHTSADTDGELLSSNSTTSHRPDVRFRYLVGGRTYRSERLYPSVIVRSYASVEAAQAELAPYPVDAQVQAWVNPAHPEQGFLRAEASHAPLVFLVLGLVLPPLAWVVGGYL